MKLKTPIVVTIETVENAVLLMIIGETKAVGERQENLSYGATPGEINKPLGEALEAQGIDWKTWEAPKPLQIGEHKAKFLPDGSVRIGCTTVDRPTLEAAYKLSTEAMGQGAEWPKWFQFHGTIYRLESATKGGKVPNPYCNWTLAEMIELNAKPLTPHEAKAILEGK